MSLKILIVEDDPVQQQTLRLMLEERLGYVVRIAPDARTALAALQGDPDIRLTILDFGLPDINGIDVLEIITQRHPGLPVVILTGHADVEHAVEAMKAGAYDFLTKPPECERLQVALRNALKTSLLEREVSRLKRREKGAFTFDQLIGHDSSLAGIIRIGRKAAASDIPVLLTGETGTGKEVFARAIHDESRRVGGPFVAVNCGAIPENLVESILFGHEKGAFTGAIAKSIGKFREAEGGTIFLDEVGDLPLDAQVKLLRVLQQKEISPVGGTHAVPVNVRIISATNRDLEADVKSTVFRDDLYFRLNVLPVRLPALRERPADIPVFAAYFIERFAAAESRGLKTLSPAARKMLAARPWPGNVRELENTIHRAMVLCEGDTLDVADFSALPVTPPGSPAVVTDDLPVLALIDANGHLRSLADIERDAMQFSLSHCAGNVTRAAAALGMAKSTFYRKCGAHCREQGVSGSNLPPS